MSRLRRGLGVCPASFRGDVLRTGVETLADVSPAPAALSPRIFPNRWSGACWSSFHSMACF